jgi:Domain of Unknown Function with PDB structure (DUF3857)
MKKYAFVLPILLAAQLATAQLKTQFDVKTIPDSLRNGATSVYRIDETIIDVKSASQYSYNIHQAYTIFNKRGLDYFEYLVVPADKFIKLDELDVHIYDSNGIEMKRYKRKDFTVIGSPLNDGLISDDKNYVLQINVKELPCTIEVNFKLNFNSYLDFPDWKAASFYGALENSSYRITVPDSLGLRYKAYNTGIKPVITAANNLTTYEWKVQNVREIDEEAGSFSWWAYFPRVAIAPNEFEFDDYKGSFKSWKDYGAWSYPFYNEPQPFKPAEAEKIKADVAGITGTREKINFLYKKMQQETRYVSIQLGIGGFKPFPASYVHEKKYGDCKALTNYMKQQLQVVGIKSYAAIIKSGSNSYPADPQFPNEGFDHIILCVPLEKDTMWLECTSSLNQPGVLGTFTENRNAVLVTENGGILVNTPRSNPKDNIWKASTLTQIYDDGSSMVDSRIFVAGEFYEKIYYLLKDKSKDDIKKAIVKYFKFKNPDDFELKILGDSANGQNLHLKLVYTKFYDVKAGSKYFMAEKEYPLNDLDIKADEKRRTDFLFPFPFVKTDSVVYILPAGFKPEPLPEQKNLSNNFAAYNNLITYNQTANTISVQTNLKITNHIVPVIKYNEVAALFEQIKKDEAKKLVLKKEQ